MKQIDISTKTCPNTFALVDDSDYESLNVHKWSAIKTRNTLYAHRKITENGKQTVILMHIVIVGKIENKEVDHRNSNGIDNQRHNFRHCTHSENLMNRGAPENNTSGYKGVNWNTKAEKWLVRIKCGNVRVHLGYFTCLIKGAKAYDRAAKELHGEFARLNFPK
jgi:hypothetical protein